MEDVGSSIRKFGEGSAVFKAMRKGNNLLHGVIAGPSNNGGSNIATSSFTSRSITTVESRLLHLAKEKPIYRRHKPEDSSTDESPDRYGDSEKIPHNKPRIPSPSFKSGSKDHFRSSNKWKSTSPFNRRSDSPYKARSPSPKKTSQSRDNGRPRSPDKKSQLHEKLRTKSPDRMSRSRNKWRPKSPDKRRNGSPKKRSRSRDRHNSRSHSRSMERSRGKSRKSSSSPHRSMERSRGKSRKSSSSPHCRRRSRSSGRHGVSESRGKEHKKHCNRSSSKDRKFISHSRSSGKRRSRSRDRRDRRRGRGRHHSRSRSPSSMFTSQWGQKPSHVSRSVLAAVNNDKRIREVTTEEIEKRLAAHQEEVQKKASEEAEKMHLPGYLNPAMVNVRQFKQMQEKRKLLWSKSNDKKEGGTQWAGAFEDQNNDEKFRRLMGIQENVLDGNSSKVQSSRKVLDELEKEYEKSRTFQLSRGAGGVTGIGLGFGVLRPSQ